ncbi:hypothetical protein CGRAC_0013 [Campylobacter gracilis]|uniref:Uncharacterized protein n=1 Tax=Campylobacter gracilis RM3268 TaxID=553220 RepID=C8PKR9_9BACT|nr:hypothetical protein CGRAC_0013 [Campylobacter gracilis]EEV16678.1 hypothetical protein CAMGR0001_0292 [Campylobacter gracilis RM3268]
MATAWQADKIAIIIAPVAVALLCHLTRAKKQNLFRLTYPPPLIKQLAIKFIRDKF